MQRNLPTLHLISAEELGLEVHEELYGGGTSPDDQTCLGSFSFHLFLKPDVNPNFSCIKCLGKPSYKKNGKKKQTMSALGNLPPP